MFELVHCTTGLHRECRQSHPDEQRAANRVPVHPGGAALTTFQARALFPFAVQLRDLPAEAAHLLCRLRGIGSRIVRDDPIRATGRRLDPETLHRMLVGNPLTLEPLAMPEFVRVPCEPIDVLRGTLATGIIPLTVVFERAVVRLLARRDPQPEVLGDVPRLHQHGTTRQRLVIDDVGAQVPDMLALMLPGAVRVGDAGVNQPALVQGGIDLPARDDTKTVADRVGVAARLPADQLDGERGVRVEDRVSTDDRPMWRAHDLARTMLPHQPGCAVLTASIPVDRIGRALRAVVGQVGERGVELTDQQVLTIIQTSP